MNRCTSLMALAISTLFTVSTASAIDAAKPALKPAVDAKAMPNSSVSFGFPARLVSVLPPNSSIIKTFKAEGGLTGWVIGTQDGEKMIAYTVPAGDYLIVGALVNAKGDNLTAQYTDREVPKPPVPEFSSLSSLPYIQQGNGKGKLIYMFADPYCGYCHVQEQVAELYEKNGDLNIRWIQVALLSPNSGALAEAISTSPDPAAAWKAISKKAPGALTVSKPDMTVAFAGQSKAATEAMRGFGGNGTPHIVWQDDKGITQTRAGVIGAGTIAEILKVPMALNISPELSRFK